MENPRSHFGTRFSSLLCLFEQAIELCGRLAPSGGLRLRGVVFFLFVGITGCRSEQHAPKVPPQSPSVMLVGIPPVLEPFANFYHAKLTDITFSLKQRSKGMLAN